MVQSRLRDNDHTFIGVAVSVGIVVIETRDSAGLNDQDLSGRSGEDAPGMVEIASPIVGPVIGGQFGIGNLDDARIAICNCR